jgi:hypothetical protein
MRWADDIRFLSKLAEGPNGCINWNASLDTSGYGLFRVDKRLQKAHRYSFFRVNGPIPSGLCVCHKCDNRLCVNPEHLFLGTRLENNKDRDTKGRHIPRYGTDVSTAKLTDLYVKQIRRMRAEGTSVKTIASLFGVHVTTVYRITKLQRWTHV